MQEELIFQVTQEADSGFCAQCLTHDIFAQADSWSELRDDVREAVAAFFFDSQAPFSFLGESIRSHKKCRPAPTRSNCYYEEPIFVFTVSSCRRRPTFFVAANGFA